MTLLPVLYFTIVAGYQEKLGGVSSGSPHSASTRLPTSDASSTTRACATGACAAGACAAGAAACGGGGASSGVGIAGSAARAASTARSSSSRRFGMGTSTLSPRASRACSSCHKPHELCRCTVSSERPIVTTASCGVPRYIKSAPRAIITRETHHSRLRSTNPLSYLIYRPGAGLGSGMPSAPGRPVSGTTSVSCCTQSVEIASYSDLPLLYRTASAVAQSFNLRQRSGVESRSSCPATAGCAPGHGKSLAASNLRQHEACCRSQLASSGRTTFFTNLSFIREDRTCGGGIFRGGLVRV